MVFLKKDNSITIKLIEPIDPSSPAFASASKGGGLHHLCFKCDNLDEEIARLKGHGLKVLVQPQPAEPIDNESIAFIYAKNGLNIELIDTDKMANIIHDN